MSPKVETPEDLWATCSSVLISLTLPGSVLRFKWRFLYFHLCPLPLVQSLNATEKSLALFFTSPSQAFTHVDKITPEPSLLQARQSPFCQLLLACQMLQSPLVAFYWTRSSMSMSVLNWGAQNGTQRLSCISPGLSRGEESPLSTCWQCSSSCGPGDC